MTNINSIARPYAQAAYQFASAKKEAPAWGKMLERAAEAVQQPALSNLLNNSRISAAQWFSLLSDLLGTSLNEEKKNFLRLLTENHRLSALPTIAELFKEYEALDNRSAEVQVTTAIPLDKTHQQKLADKLTQVLKQQVTLHCEVDENILGGAIVRAGDKVIDGSIRGQLTRLLEFAIR
jgi:F-type H+-transporting ATPase subunit delta